MEWWKSNLAMSFDRQQTQTGSNQWKTYHGPTAFHQRTSRPAKEKRHRLVNSEQDRQHRLLYLFVKGPRQMPSSIPRSRFSTSQKSLFLPRINLSLFWISIVLVCSAIYTTEFSVHLFIPTKLYSSFKIFICS